MRESRSGWRSDHPESPDLASDMGGTLNNMATINLDGRQFYKARAKLAPTIDWQRKALAANPNHPMYRQFMATHLGNLVRATEGLGRADLADDARRRLAELAASDPAKAVLDARLADVLNGKEIARDDAERIPSPIERSEGPSCVVGKALRGSIRQRSQVADDRTAQHAYNAACAAALAGCGQGKTTRRQRTPPKPSWPSKPVNGSRPSDLGEDRRCRHGGDEGDRAANPPALENRHRPRRRPRRERAGQAA